MSETAVSFAYLAASVLFILGMKGLSSAKTAVRGNLMAFIAELGARAELFHSSTEEDRHTLDLTLPEAWGMPAFLAWAVQHVEVLEARPVRLSMEEVFVQTVESVGA